MKKVANIILERAGEDTSQAGDLFFNAWRMVGIVWHRESKAELNFQMDYGDLRGRNTYFFSPFSLG